MHNIWVACDWHLFNREVEPGHPFRSTRNIGKLGDHYADMIQDDDLFIYLGDLCDPEVTDKEALTTIIKSIPGYKVLCMGNHDTQDIVFYYDIGFDKVCDVLRIHNLLFSHKPIRVAPDELNVHGHLHTEKLSSLDYQHINAYASNYNRDDQPILLDDLIDSAMIQDPNVVNDTKSLNQIREKFEKYTSIVSGEKYRDIYDLSDKISLSPVDESVKSTNDYVMRNLFFISKDGDYDETIVQPRIPDNYMTQNGFEDNKTPRVCFSTSIDGCLMGLGQNITNKEFYVYHPVGKHKVITPTEEQVPDVKITKERWICEPVELTCIGKIKAIDVNGPKDDGIPYRYGKNKEHEARLYSWGYKWIQRFNESIQPSIVALSASVEEDEPVQKKRQRPIDEILFPDVDSTRYFEADDDAANKREDGANYGDDRPVHKVIHKNDVVADGQANLEESSKYITKKKVGSFEHLIIHYDQLNPSFVKEFGETEVEMFSKDILDNYTRINPEQLNRERIVAVKKAEDLIDYFEEVVDNFDAEYTDAYNGSIETFGDILRTVKRRHNSASEYKDAFANLIPLNLDEDQFVAFIKSRIKEMDYIEAMLSNMLRSNMDLYRIALAEIDYLESTSDDKTHLKALKKYIDDHESEFIKKSTGSSKTIVYDYSKLHRGVVIVDKNIFNNPDEKKYVKPSRMLIRAATHDVIVLSHGTPNEDGKFTFDPIDYDGRTFTDVESIVKYLNKDEIKKIAIYACNVNRIIFDNADVNFKQTEYASTATVLESAIPNAVTEVHNLLKSWNKKIEKRIKAITKLEQKVYRVIGIKEHVLWPKFVYFYAKSNDFIEATQFRPESADEFDDIAQDSFELLFNLYRQLLFFAKSAVNIYTDVFSGTVSESGGYYWTLKPSAGMMLIQRDGITPVTTKYHYHSIDECINDASLYLQLNLTDCSNKPSLVIYENTKTGDGELVKQISYKELIDQTGNQDNDVSVINTPTVYFTRLITPESLKEIFKLICPNFVNNNDEVMVKINSGEMGNTHYLHPELIGELVEFINGTICDTITVYEGERDTKEKQIDTLKAHGFEKIGKIDVLDGDGERSIDIPDGLILKTVRIGVGCFNYKFHLILSHFKGHPMAGYGGAIKNVAIGCASRSGKSQIHTYGQSSDITVGFLDSYDQTSFLKAMADAASAFIKTMQINGPVLYINVANNLSVDCDCIAQPEKPTITDIGIFASWDPVAIDSACIDAVYYAKDSQDLINRIESKHGTDLLDYAEKLGIGSKSYHLVDLDKNINESSSKVYNTTSDIGPMDREEKEKVAEKYGLRAVGQELPSKEEERRKTPEQRYEERNKKRNAALKKARKAKKRKAFVRKLKSHLPGVKNEEAELIRESNSVVDASDVNIPDGVEHSPLYGDKKDFFYNYDYPKDTNAYAERMKLEESTHASTVDPSHKQKGRLSLESLKHITVDEKWRKANVPDHPWLRHFASADQDTDVSAWLKNGDIVAAISVDKTPTKRDKIWIHNLHIENKYRGYGLAKQLLDYATRTYKANALAVKIDNKLAQKVYLNYGFNFGKDSSDTMGNSKIMYLDEMAYEDYCDHFYIKLKHLASEYNKRDDIFKHTAKILKMAEKDLPRFECSVQVSGEKQLCFSMVNPDTPFEIKCEYEKYLKEMISDLEKDKETQTNCPHVSSIWTADAEGTIYVNLDYENINENTTKIKEDPITKDELKSLGIRDLRTFQRWMKNNVRYKNMTNLMTPREVLEQKVGSCHDQVVLELAVLKTLGYHPTAYSVLEHDNKPSGSQGGETHSYVVVKDNGKQYWFENAWSRYAGLHAVTDPKFIKKMHEERSWGDSNKFSELEVVRFAGEPGDSLQELVDHCFNDKQEINENSIRDTYQFELIEDVKFFDKLDESANKSKKLYPVYIMLVHSGTTVSNAIKFVSKSKFSHASISFDSSMDHMYSFARKDPSNPFFGGFRYESIGKGFYDKKEIPYALYVVPCTESQIKKMKKRLDYFIKNESKFQFDFAGLVKNYLGIVDNPEYRWFCSRFVADILNAGAPKNKPYVAEPSLQDPDDFMRDEYATYVIGGDNLMKYNRALVDKRTRKIIREEEMARSVKNESAIYDMDWNNPYAEQVLDYQLSCMDESIVHDFMNYLKSYKLKFDNDGNIIIRRREYDQLDAHFRASVKLIKASEKAGDWETVKAELAKLYYMSGLIYEQCDRKQSKKSTPHVREDLMDLRSVILNVFQQHLKTVMNHDPKFNFNAYYETTKYSRDTTIPKAVLTSLGKTVITLLS